MWRSYIGLDITEILIADDCAILEDQFQLIALCPISELCDRHHLLYLLELSHLDVTLTGVDHNLG